MTKFVAKEHAKKHAAATTAELETPKPKTKCTRLTILRGLLGLFLIVFSCPSILLGMPKQHGAIKRMDQPSRVTIDYYTNSPPPETTKASKKSEQQNGKGDNKATAAPLKQVPAAEESAHIAATKSEQSNPAVVFPLPPDEWLEDIDTTNPARCGHFKCAYDSKTNNDPHHSQPQKYGYLVSKRMAVSLGHRVAKDYNFQSTVKAYDFGNLMAETFGIRHCMLAPPERFRGTRELCEKLAANATRPLEKRMSVPDFQDVSNPSKLMLYVQPIVLAPPTSAFFGCDRKYKQAMKLDELKKASTNKSVHLSPSELQQFEDTVAHEFNVTMRMLDSALGQCMINQFQLFIDVATGNFYHIDIERCFDGNQNRITKGHSKCSNKLLEYVNLLLASKGGSPLVHPIQTAIDTQTKQKTTREK